MLVFSSGKDRQTFTDENKAVLFFNKKKFEGYKVRVVKNNSFKTQIVFYDKQYH